MKGNNLASGASSGSNLDVAIDMSRRQQRGLSIEKNLNVEQNKSIYIWINNAINNTLRFSIELQI